MAFRLAHLQERKTQLSEKPRLYSPLTPLLPSPTFLPTQPPPTALPSTNATTNTTPPTPTPMRPLHRLSQSQLQECRLNGLCYYCNNKYTFGHQCKASFNILLGEDDLQENAALCDQPPFPSPELLAFDSPSKISLHALTGSTDPRTLRLTGYIHGKPITILVDSGSTHNFVQPRVAELLRLTISPANPFDVTVGNGSTISCQGRC